MVDEEFEDEELTKEEEEALEEILGYGHPTQEEKQNIYSYFKKVISMEDNSKTANLTNDEMGFARTPIRTCQEIALYCKKMGMHGFANYFQDEAQIILGTSLSREGFLNKLAVTQKRESEFKSRLPIQPKQSFWGKKKKQQFGKEELL